MLISLITAIKNSKLRVGKHGALGSPDLGSGAQQEQRSLVNRSHPLLALYNVILKQSDSPLVMFMPITVYLIIERCILSSIISQGTLKLSYGNTRAGIGYTGTRYMFVFVFNIDLKCIGLSGAFKNTSFCGGDISYFGDWDPCSTCNTAELHGDCTGGQR